MQIPPHAKILKTDLLSCDVSYHICHNDLNSYNRVYNTITKYSISIRCIIAKSDDACCSVFHLYPSRCIDVRTCANMHPLHRDSPLQENGIKPLHTPCKS